MRKLFSYVMLMAAGLLISGNAWAEPTKVAEMTALEQTTSFYWEEGATGQDNVYASAYDALTAALAALPDNSTPATVKLFSNVQFGYENSYLIIQKYRNVTIDLNGHKITTSTEYVGGAQLIENKGTLIIDDSSEGKNGAISNLPYNADTQEIPSYGKYLIKNTGTLILNNGTLEVTPPAGADACYIVENEVSTENNYSSSFIMNGGKLEMLGAVSTIRIQMNNPKSGATNTVEIKGGELISGDHVIDIHSNGSNNMPNIIVNISGGTLTSTRTDQPAAILRSIVMGNHCDHHLDAVHINITGGTLNGALRLGEAWRINRKPISVEQVSITGGTFMKQPCIVTKLSPYVVNGYEVEGEYKGFITGGIFANFDSEGYTKFQENIDGYIAEDYAAVAYDGFDHSETDLIIATTDKKNVDVENGEKNLNDLVSDIKDNGTTEITIVPNTTEGQQTIINITEDTKVNKIEVTAPESKGEAQIVVKNGVTLDVGNGGIVSENDILTTVLVESGGTLIIGTGGVDKKGAATPIKIQASEGKGTGALIFSPNAKHEDTEKYAEVDLYTYCKKVNGKYHWQQFAIPVTGLANEKVAKNPNVTSYVFEWDYATYGWSQLNNWNQLNEPFAGYDMTNVSENGGVVYTFKGDLIGNQNIQLTLPHKNYCVMGNSYTAPISIDALFEQISKEMDQSEEGTIEKTVYKYDAKAGYYVYTNELEQTLAKIGIMNAAFTDIKPMEGFLLNLQNGNTAGVMLNYANAVFTPATKSTAPASAPARQATTTDMMIAKMMVNSANYTDCMTLVEGNEFSADIENGKDAYKYINEDGINIYVFNDNVKLAMLASDNIEGTNIAFQSAADDEYTLTFPNVINNEYELLDLQTNIRVPMIEGNAYTFTATPNTLNPSRFMVVASRTTPTGSERVKAVKNVKGIYTMLGQYMGNAEAWSSLPAGVYVVNGVQMAK